MTKKPYITPLCKTAELQIGSLICNMSTHDEEAPFVGIKRHSCFDDIDDFDDF